MTVPTIFFGLLAAAATTVSVPAFAQDSRTVEVRFADLNLASDGGAKALKERVARAARTVCSINGDRSLDQVMAAKSCTKAALAKAAPQIELALANGGSQLADNSRMSVSAR